jgi:diguanylate cyclase (GGDEF)-like protein
MENNLNETDSGIIKHYDLLKEIGVLDQIQSFNNEIHNLKDLLEESIELFNKHTIIELVNYLTKKMLNKFVPSTLAFFIQKELSPDEPQVICFQNMQEVESSVKIESLKAYRKFFMLSPTSITFEAFEVMLDDKSLTDVFKPMNPEIIVPMMGLDGMYGFIIFGKKILEGKYTKNEIQYIDWIMKFASISLQNNIHYLRANVDLKTGLYNHAFFIKRLNEELARLKRYDYEISLMMFDIDFFKKVNDTYGHIAGDKIIFGISKIITDNIRDEDVASRFGGEEFAVLLVQCKDGFAREVAERIRRSVEEFDFVHEDKIIKATISIGIAKIGKECKISANEIIEIADTALYQSKSNGRNQSTFCGNE